MRETKLKMSRMEGLGGGEGKSSKSLGNKAMEELRKSGGRKLF